MVEINRSLHLSLFLRLFRCSRHQATYIECVAKFLKSHSIESVGTETFTIELTNMMIVEGNQSIRKTKSLIIREKSKAESFKQ